MLKVYGCSDDLVEIEGDLEYSEDEIGLPHLSHLTCNIAFLCELESNNHEQND